MQNNAPDAPSSILIVGAGVFGLSTALALLRSPRYDHTTITIVDSRTPTPSSTPWATQPTTASIDSSRIIRADYAIPAYASLAAQAQTLWREGFGGKGAYRECGLCFTANKDGKDGDGYVKASLENVRKLNGREKGKEREKVETQQGIKEPEDSIEYLEDDEAVRRVMHMEGTGKGVGEWGYVNWRSGWADAAGTIIETRRKIQEIADTRGGVEWVSGSAARLLFSPSRIEGILLNSGQSLHANLTILAAGAWSSYLLPRSLKSLVSATGQVLAYLQLTPEESKRLENIPVLLNESTGMFLIPPTSDGVLKIARHGFGYRNPVCLADPEPILNEDEDIEVSLPSEDFTTLPEEAHYAFRTFLAQTLPWLASRPFIATRICWYTDTPTGDFLIDFHPWYGKSLLLATGGSGHGFKFLPVLGEKIVERIEGRLGAELSELWKWRIGDEDWNGMCEDGSRGGQRGMELRRELRDSIQGFEGEGQRYR